MKVIGSQSCVPTATHGSRTPLIGRDKLLFARSNSTRTIFDTDHRVTVPRRLSILRRRRQQEACQTRSIPEPEDSRKSAQRSRSTCRAKHLCLHLSCCAGKDERKRGPSRKLGNPASLSTPLHALCNKRSVGYRCQGRQYGVNRWPIGHEAASRISSERIDNDGGFLFLKKSVTSMVSNFLSGFKLWI